LIITFSILAAGLSRRFGSPKLIEKIEEKTIIVSTAENVINSCNYPFVRSEKVLITGSYKDILLSGIPDEKKSEFTIMENKHCENGISTSLNLAISYSMTVLSDGMLLYFGDMPFISPEFSKKILGVIIENPRKIIRPIYRDIPGFPVYFPKKYFHMFMKLEGNQGARNIIRENLHDFIPVKTDYENCTIDIDSKNDLEKYKKQRNTE